MASMAYLEQMMPPPPPPPGLGDRVREGPASQRERGSVETSPSVQGS